MNRAEFLSALRAELERQYISGADNMTEYYDEMICDRMEEGMSEEEAVASLGSIEDIVNEALIDRPMTTIVRDRVKKSKDNAEKKGHGALWITLAILGFPVWFPLLIAAFAVGLSLYVTLWAVLISVWLWARMASELVGLASDTTPTSLTVRPVAAANCAESIRSICFS